MAREAAWLTADKQGLAAVLLQSHQRAFSRPLIASAQPGQRKRLLCQNLFACGFPVLAHGTEQDPALSYANAAALQLWDSRWDELIGMPSRLTAPNSERAFNIDKMVAKGKKLIKLYNDAGVSNDRVLIKLASTWEGIKAGEILEKEGINCNLTLLFSFAQARACAEAGVFLISPFVGRIMDWYKAKTGQEYAPADDPGVQSVTRIYNWYKEHGFNTVVMGASFRNIGEITELAGCDRLTVAPALLTELENTEGTLDKKLVDNGAKTEKPAKLTEEQFRFDHNEDAMATEKLAEGIRNFVIDQNKLEKALAEKL